MAKLTLPNLANLQNETTAVNTVNYNNDLIELAVENTLSRDGTAPNQMGAALDMNSNRILNLPAPLTSTEPARVADLNAVIGQPVNTSIPAGGAGSTVLTKNSATSYDMSWIAPTAFPSIRTSLTTTRTYYVNGSATLNAACYPSLTCSPGSDSNDGLTIATPFLTPQKAWNTIANDIDLRGQGVVIQLADGDGEAGATGYNAANNPTAPGNVIYGAYTPPGLVDIGSVIVQGNLGNSDLVVLKGTTSTGCYFGGIGGNANVLLQAVKIKCTSGDAMICGRGATVEFDNVNFGTCGGNHLTAFHGANVYTTNYKVSGNATFHAAVQSGAFFAPHGATIVYSNNPIFTINFYASDGGTMFLAGMTFTNGNTVTGIRAFCTTNSYISTLNSSLTYLPGTVVPSISTGGQYDTLPSGGINEVSGVMNNATYSATAADFVIEQVGVMSAPRTINLPPVIGFAVGRKLMVVDISGTVGAVNKITATPFSTDTINGASVVTDLVTTAFGSAELFSTGGAWVKLR